MCPEGSNLNIKRKAVIHVNRIGVVHTSAGYLACLKERIWSAGMLTSKQFCILIKEKEE
jgi:hypothetical protein